jgi:deazaflavin-dependent oxidoreductase (nitroreductase family)
MNPVATPRRLLLRRFAMRFVDPITRRFAGRVPGFVVIRYVGRRSGRVYDTPMFVFHVAGDCVFALTYGPEVQWVKNVLAAGRMELRERGHTTELRDPELFTDPRASLMPIPVRQLLRLMRVSDFLRMRPAPSLAE